MSKAAFRYKGRGKKTIGTSPLVSARKKPVCVVGSLSEVRSPPRGKQGAASSAEGLGRDEPPQQDGLREGHLSRKITSAKWRDQKARVVGA